MTRHTTTVVLLSAALVLAVSATTFAGGGKEAGQRVSPEEAYRMMQDGTVLMIDVRDEASYVTGHIATAVHVPLSEVASRADELSAGGRTIIAYCSCPAEESSLAAAADLVAAGATDVYVLDGGIAAWANAGLPLKRGPRP